MSYAEIASKGPKQSPEEVSLPATMCPGPGLIRFIGVCADQTLLSHPSPTDSSCSRAPPVPELNHTESEGSNSLVDVDSPHVSSVKSDYEDQKVKTQTQATRLEHEAEDEAREAKKQAIETGEKVKKEAATAAKKAEKELKKDGKKLSENRDNPVVVGNAVIWGVGAVALGVAAYNKHKEGKLDWQLAGTVAAVVGAFGVADYFASQWLLENKYPPK